MNILESVIAQQVSFVPTSGGYVSFVGIRGDGVRGVIAIDDVTLYQGNCQSKSFFFLQKNNIFLHLVTYEFVQRCR